MKPKLQFMILVQGLLAILTGLIVNAASNAFPPEISLLTPYVWPLLGLVTLLSIFLTIFQSRLQTSGDSSEDRRRHLNRRRMIAKVRAIWVTGILEQSLRRTKPIVLAMKYRVAAIGDPWRLDSEESQELEEPLPDGTYITQVFDAAGGELLILGDAGAGKTTLLLDLARDLLDRADNDHDYPIPVVFRLASWAEKRQSIAHWLIEELVHKYHVSRSVGQYWIDYDQLLPLLDGFDEVPRIHQEACVSAINCYRQTHGLMPLAISSRSDAYLSQAQHVRLRCAVVIQPLSTEQIANYLESEGSQLEMVRRILQMDPVLREMVTTPLMLSVLSSAYRGEHPDSFSSEALPVTRQQLFATYTKRMIEHRGRSCYSPEEINRWLTWLARQMTRHAWTEFYLERMQPDWLDIDDPSIAVRGRLARGLLQRLGGGRLTNLLTGLLAALVWAISYGLAAAFYKGLFYGVLVGLPVALCLVVAIIGSRAEIEPVERLAWSWTPVLIALLAGASGAIIAAPIMGLFLGLFIGLPEGILYMMVGTMLMGLMAAPLVGFSTEKLVKRSIVKPNQGILNSARNGLMLGLLGGIVVALGLGFLDLLFHDLWFRQYDRVPSDIRNWLLTNGLMPSLPAGQHGFVMGLLFGMPLFTYISGGEAWFKHLSLRLLLITFGWTPPDYVHFLDYASDRLLLRKVGGGYIFVHHLLQSHFSNLSACPDAPNRRIPRKISL